MYRQNLTMVARFASVELKLAAKLRTHFPLFYFYLKSLKVEVKVSEICCLVGRAEIKPRLTHCVFVGCMNFTILIDMGITR